MSDRDVTALLDRMAAATPAMDVSLPEVVSTGRRRIRHRRAVSSGMALASLVLVVAVWLGVGPDGGGVLGTQPIAPAGSWQVDEPSTVELPDGLQLVGNVRPLTLSRGPGGSAATFVVDGIEETVAGRTSGEGVEVYAGVRVTAVVWEAGTQALVWPAPQASLGRTDVVVAGERLSLWVTDAAGYEPADVLLYDDDTLRTAEGAQVETAQLADGRVDVTAYDIPSLDVSGYLDGASLYEVDTLTVASVDRPWWRGGGFDLTTVARLPREAVFAREVLRDGSEVLRASEPQVTALVGDWSMALFVSEWAGGGPEAQDLSYEIEWSTDGETWQEQPTDLTRAPTGSSATRVGPGEGLEILGGTYRVATDAHGWPRLVGEDGTTFLAGGDEAGTAPSAGSGGSVMWREHWWPWSDRHRVDFTVQEVGEITLIGPSGQIGLDIVPAGTDR